MTKYWAFRCKNENSPEIKCSLTNSTNCLISIDEMPIPEEYWGYCWITKEPVLFKLEDDQGDDELTVNDVRKLFEVFRNRGGTINNKIICDFGKDLGYNQHRVHVMMEMLLDFGYIHEPIQGQYAMTRDLV